MLCNAFLPEIAGGEQRDRVSSRGYAAGYLGGGLLLAANLAFIAGAPHLGIDSDLAARLCFLSAGVWWAVFSWPSLRRLRSRGPARTKPPGRSLVGLGLSELAATLRQLRGRPHTRRFLIAYLLYNDGIQTVIAVAAVFLAQELFVAHGRPTDRLFIALNFLMVQVVGFLGALLFAALAARTRTRTALVISLVIWSGAIVYGYAFLRGTTDAVLMSAVIALVLGGSQALSRSLFSRMIPPGREASFFAIYEISSSGTSWIGPVIFGAVVAATNSYREALLSLIALFVAGTALLASTDVEGAFAEARGEGAPDRPARRRQGPARLAPPRPGRGGRGLRPPRRSRLLPGAPVVRSGRDPQGYAAGPRGQPQQLRGGFLPPSRPSAGAAAHAGQEHALHPPGHGPARLPGGGAQGLPPPRPGSGRETELGHVLALPRGAGERRIASPSFPRG